MNLAGASHMERDQMLANFQHSSADHLPPLPSGREPSKQRSPSKGYLLRMKEGIASQFFGETSFYPIVPSVDEGLDEDLRPSRQDSKLEVQQTSCNSEPSTERADDLVPYSHITPQSLVSQQAMSAYFQHCYYYHMVLYREYFLRDYKAGNGPYYSDILFYAIASIGALISNNDEIRDLSDIFYTRAERLLYGGALDTPNITTIQALLLLGQRDVGRGKATKGWLLTGLLR
jgi:Fungal specific transcription factor domain